MKTTNRKYPFHYYKNNHQEMKTVEEDVYYEDKNGKTYLQFFAGQSIPVTIFNQVFGKAKVAENKFSEMVVAEANKEVPYDEPTEQVLGEQATSMQSISPVSSERVFGETNTLFKDASTENEEVEKSEEEVTEEKPRRKRHKSIIKK